MSETSSPGTTRLAEEHGSIFESAAKTLVRIASNILKNPAEEKYQRIRSSSRVFSANLKPCSGAIQCLLEMGFKVHNGGEEFVFGAGESIASCRQIHSIIVRLCGLKGVHLDPQLTTIPAIRPKHNHVTARIHAHWMHAGFYEDEALLNKARVVVPQEALKQKAKQMFESRPNQDKEGKKIKSFEHCLFVELLAWFKRDFFTWTDKPKCDRCTDDQQHQRHAVGQLSPTPEESTYGASVVEGYRCGGCPSNVIRFPRYNHPGKLLETRTGRCGEWANCFTLVACSMGFEARRAVDWSDHVWTEVFLYDRWIHCDPCENAFDRPLMYERGWGKKLNLVVAASRRQIADVTPRYITCTGEKRSRRDELARRRGEASFDSSMQQVEGYIAMMNAQIMQNTPDPRKNELKRRNESEKRELESLLTRVDDNDDDTNYEGRTSGSLQWRLDRGETSTAGGGDKKKSKDKFDIDFPAIEPNQHEVDARRFKLQYSSATNKYMRAYGKIKDEICWESYVCKSKNMMRKEELDWKKTYLCREESSRRGYVTWSVKLPPGVAVEQLSVEFHTYEVDRDRCCVIVASPTRCDVIKSGEVNEFADEYRGCGEVSIKCCLFGQCWQHAQLFRQDSTSTQPLFTIDITMMDKEE